MLKISIELTLGDARGETKHVLSKVCFSTSVRVHC